MGEDEKRDVTPVELPSLPPTLYLGVDGTGVPMRAEELQGRSGKQPDGSAKTREVKLCTVWSAEGRDTEGIVRYATQARSAIPQPSKVPRLWIRMKCRRRLPSGSYAKPHAGAFRRPNAR